MDYYRGIINWEKGNVQFYQKGAHLCKGQTQRRDLLSVVCSICCAVQFMQTLGKIWAGVENGLRKEEWGES